MQDVVPEHQPPYLFLSHAGVDTVEAQRLHDQLLAHPDAVAAGLKIWFDKTSDALPLGGKWLNLIGTAIERETSCFAVYVGSRGIVNWVERETNLALSRATGDPSYRLIPILAPGSQGSSALPPFVRQHQGVIDPLGNPAAFTDLLAAVLNRGPVATRIRTNTPFVGLRSMTEKEADRFYGRKEETEEVLERMRRFRLVLISAESGSGKSSLAQAGVIPRYRGGALEPTNRAEPEGRIRHVVVMRPQNDPVEGLKLAITRAAEELGLGSDEQANLRSRVDLAKVSETAYAIRCNLPVDGTETLLVVDQLEELRTSPAKVQEDFLALLHTLAATPGDNGFRVLLTVREDYLDLFVGPKLLGPALARDNKEARYNLDRISDDPGLVDAITEPLKMAGRTDEGELQTLVQLFQQDTRKRPGDLALVQMALFVIWQRRQEFRDNLVTTYVGVGGVSGALANEAERVRNILPEVEQELLFSIFIRLMRLGSTGGATRRTAKFAEFDAPHQALIEKLTRDDFGRLLMRDGDTVELAHEALITRWAWLNEHLNAPNVAVQARRLERLIDRAETWSGKWLKTSELATGNELDGYAELRKARRGWLSKKEDRFVAAGLRTRIGTAVAAAVVVGGLIWVAATVSLRAVRAEQERASALAASVQERQEAAERAEQAAIEAEALARKAAADARAAEQMVQKAILARIAIADGDRPRAIRLAVEVLESDAPDTLKAEALPVLYGVLASRLPVRGIEGEVIGWAGGLLRLKKSAEGVTTISQYDGGNDEVRVVAEIPRAFDTCTFAVCFDDHETVALDTGTGHQLPPGKLVLAASAATADLILAGFETREDMLDGLYQHAELFVGSQDGEPGTLGTFQSDPEWDPINAEWSPLGDFFGVMSQHRAVVYQKEKVRGVELAIPEDMAYSPRFMRFSQDASVVATTSSDYPEVRIWDATTGELLTTLQSGTREALDVAYSPAADRIVIGSQQGSVRLFSLPDGRLETAFATRTPAVSDVDYDLTGSRICALWADGTAMVWNSSTLSVVEGPLKAHRGIAERVVCQDSRLYLSGPWGTEVWDVGDSVTTPMLSITPLDDPGGQYGLSFTAAGRAMIIVDGQGVCAQVWVGGTGAVGCGVAMLDAPPVDQHGYPGLEFAESLYDDSASANANEVLCSPEVYDPPVAFQQVCVPALPAEPGSDAQVKQTCELMPASMASACEISAMKGEIVLRAQTAGDSPAQVAAIVTSRNRMLLFDAATGALLESMQFSSEARLAQVVGVRYDRAARMLFLFRGLDYAEMWDAASGRLLVTAPTDYTFLGSPLAVAEVDTSHNMLAAYRDRGLYEYRYFDNASDLLALANVALERLGAQ